MPARSRWDDVLTVTDPPVAPSRVAHGPGKWIPVTSEEYVEEFGQVLLRFELIDGRSTCTGLHIERRTEIEARTLRALPLGKLAAEAGKHAVVWPEALPTPSDIERPGGRRGFSQEHYRQVARVYAEALGRSPKRPIRWMTDNVYAGRPDSPSEDTVRRWVRRARSMGLLDQEGQQ